MMKREEWDMLTVNEKKDVISYSFLVDDFKRAASDFLTKLTEEQLRRLLIYSLSDSDSTAIFRRWTLDGLDDDEAQAICPQRGTAVEVNIAPGITAKLGAFVNEYTVSDDDLLELASSEGLVDWNYDEPEAKEV